MAPLDHFQAGIWKVSLDSLDNAGTTTIKWELPALRSYHTSALVGGKLDIHAGCLASGRLATLHAYDLTGTTHTWHNPPNLAVVSEASNSPKSHRAHPPLDIYTPSTDAQSTVYPTPDPERPWLPRHRAAASPREGRLIDRTRRGWRLLDDAWLLLVTPPTSASSPSLELKRQGYVANPIVEFNAPTH
ncbi:hypothetical protein EV363DRAFT_1425991 [Boletus edulis]|nr:hypothetical protein EV363DRAFT_1425991 [Boletus edulis]